LGRYLPRFVATNVELGTYQRFGTTTFHVPVGLLFWISNSFHFDLLIAEQTTALDYQLKKDCFAFEIQ
jgi:hypothetical protein